MEPLRVLVINPGSTSTKLALYEGEGQVFAERAGHPDLELRRFPDIPSQLEYRLSLAVSFLKGRGVDPGALDAVSVRGGLMKPVKSGVYRVNARMVEDLLGSKARWGHEHASNLGPMMGLRLSERYGAPAFTADPVTVDEFDEVARISGIPEIERKSHLHALNIKAVLRRAARDAGLEIGRSNFVVAHVGGGISVAAIRRGRIVDVNNALLGMGPFSPVRAGALPIGDLVSLAYSGRYDKQALERKLAHESGLTGYLGTSDVKSVERLIGSGDGRAELIFSAMAYQVAKEVAAMAAVLKGEVEAVILTGGVANSERFVDMVAERAGFVAGVMVYPGEEEMDALAYYARAALLGLLRVLDYE